MSNAKETLLIKINITSVLVLFEHIVFKESRYSRFWRLDVWIYGLIITYSVQSVMSTRFDSYKTRQVKAWPAIYWLVVKWKSDISDKIKHSFFQAAVISILIYECTTWTLIKRMEKKHDPNYTRTKRVVLYKSLRQHPPQKTAAARLPTTHHENHPN